MPKEIARKPESYENGAYFLAWMPALLVQHGFWAVATKREQAMKFLDTKAADGSNVRFGAIAKRLMSATSPAPCSRCLAPNG